jgi:prepilin-type N-terminal cleavage/methylation domain-containing protein
MKSGFTLVETALSLAVAGLLLAIAVPSFSALKQGVRVEQAAQSLVAAHRRARIVAIVHGKPAILSVAASTLRITLIGRAGHTGRLPVRPSRGSPSPVRPAIDQAVKPSPP